MGCNRSIAAWLRQATVTASLLCLSSTAPAAELALSDSRDEALRRLIEGNQAEEELVGVQAAIYFEGKIVFTHSSGFADIEHRVPVTARTRFEIASVTKAFTALALLLLEERNEIDLDAPVQRYVPGFPEKDEGPLTPRMLAGCLGGIRHYNTTERTPDFYATHYDDVLDAIGLFQNDPLVASPGQRFVYSSYGYNLLAAVLQGAAGERFQDHMRRVLLDPMGLDSTGYIDVRYPMAGRARLYSFLDPFSRETSENLMVVPNLEHSYNAGGGNMYSTAEDLAAFGNRFLAPGFLSKRVLDQIYAPHQTLDGEDTWFSDGWVLSTMAANPPSMIAGGAYPGVQAMLRVYPEDALVVAVLTNTWGKNGSESAFSRQLPGALAETVLRFRGADETPGSSATTTPPP